MDRIKIFIVLTISFSAVLLGCRKSDSEEVSLQDQQKTAADTPQKQLWLEEISLDNGQKWRADEATTSGIESMIELVEKNTPSTPEDYRKLGAALNDEKNLLIKRCTMEGPPHDNLHIYLQPLLEKIAALQQTTSSEKGREKLSEIRVHLEKYYEFFQ